METVKNIIVFDKVSKVYHIGEQEVRALDEASMYIREHEFVSIIGPSGSGKSTMMNIIGCLDTADSGHYILNGQAIESYSETELSHIRNRQIGFIFQNFNLIGNLTAEENIELPLIYQRLPKKERKKRVNDALKLMKLDNRGLHRPSELSGGQQQRIAIARAIAARPPLILADEPTGNLDSRTGDEIMQIFHELHDRGNTIVLITHDENVAKQASRSIRILDGRVTEVDE
ncbi:MAG: ABC transporter ATP-binding protein [Lachnospiraceae bacterium]